MLIKQAPQNSNKKSNEGNKGKSWNQDYIKFLNFCFKIIIKKKFPKQQAHENISNKYEENINLLS